MVYTNKRAHISSNKNLFLYSTLALTAITSISAYALSSSIVSADDVIDNVAVTVQVACTMSGTGMNSHSAEVVNGTYRADIGTTTIKAFCNDPNGFSIYAIGFTGDEYTGTNHTKLVGTNDNTKTIATGTATSGSTSNWAMKLATNSGATYPITLTNGYGSYSNVPDTYTKVAQRTSGTDTGESATGSELTTTYAAFISSTQAADTYVGKVKYTMVHPYDVDAPTPPPAPPTTCNTPVPNITYMQDITSSNKSTVLASLTEDAPYYLRDNRDEEPYCVSKLKDGNLWLLDNLRLDLSDAETLAAVAETNTNASATTLGYLKNGGGSSPYPATGVNTTWASSSDDKYDEPKVVTTYKDTTTSSFGAGSGKIGVYYNYCAASAGSYCYAGNAGTGNATEDLCPANWRMPTSTGEYQALYTAYSSNVSSFKNALSTPYSGYFHSGSADSQSYFGYFWSSTRTGGSSYGMDSLNVYGGNFSPSAYRIRDYGQPMRCLLQ